MVAYSTGQSLLYTTLDWDGDGDADTVDKGHTFCWHCDGWVAVMDCEGCRLLPSYTTTFSSSIHDSPAERDGTVRSLSQVLKRVVLGPSITDVLSNMSTVAKRSACVGIL
jgi:hypothetical protein